MSKSTTFFGQQIFSQLINSIPKEKVESQSEAHKTDRYCKRFSIFHHLITLL